MKPVVTFGEILLRLSPPFPQRFEQASALDVQVGGSECNVASALARWGTPCRLVSALPAHEIGDRICRQLAHHGIDTGAILRRGERVGIYFYEHGASLKAGRVVYDRKHSSLATAEPAAFDWDRLLRDAGWLHLSGITPALSADAAAATARAAGYAGSLQLPVSLDLNYRALLWKEGRSPIETLRPIAEQATLMLADPTSARIFFGIDAEPSEAGSLSVQDCRRLADRMFERFPRLERVLISRREAKNAVRHLYGAVLLDRESEAASDLHDVDPILDRIGAGDALMAGVIHCLHRRQPPEAAVRFGAAAGALQHAIAGDVCLASLDEIDACAAGGRGTRTIR